MHDPPSAAPSRGGVALPWQDDVAVIERMRVDPVFSKVVWADTLRFEHTATLERCVGRKYPVIS